MVGNTAIAPGFALCYGYVRSLLEVLGVGEYATLTKDRLRHTIELRNKNSSDLTFVYDGDSFTMCTRSHFGVYPELEK